MNSEELSKFIFFIFAFIMVISFVIASTCLRIPELTLSSVVSRKKTIYINQKNLTN